MGKKIKRKAVLSVVLLDGHRRRHPLYSVNWPVLTALDPDADELLPE